MTRSYSLLVLVISLNFEAFGFKWNVKPLPSTINPGGNISLQWTYTLSQSEQKQAQSFSLILIDKERYLYSNEWITLAVKAPLGGFYVPVVRSPFIQLTQDQGAGLVIYNVTSRSETRYRCTFISGFPAPRNIVTPNIKDIPTKVRLIGTRPNAGRIEIYHNGLWGTVCNNNWGLTSAAVVCKMLGYRGATLPNCGGSCVPGSGPIWISNVVCKGNEDTIDDCQHGEWGSHSCVHGMDAGVVCMPSSNTVSPISSILPTTPSFAVRLVGSNRSDSGRLEVYHNGGWGTVCDDQWDINDAKVVCRMLGYSLVNYTHSFGDHMPGSGRILMDGVRCNGNETSLADCQFDGWGVTDCGHKEDVGVSCTNQAPVTSGPATTTALPTPFPKEVRLVGANRSDFGRLEVYHNGSWGTMCDDNWDNNNAKVVCRTLGYIYVKYTGAVGANIPGSGKIHSFEFRCNGTEKSLGDCKSFERGGANCSHDKDVGVWCTNATSTEPPTTTTLPPTTTVPPTTTAATTTTVAPSSTTSLPTTAPPINEIRLAGANRSDFGRLEVYHNGTWGTVCDDNWDNNDAIVVCRTLGYLYVKFTGAVGNNIPGSGSILMDEVKCNGSEKSLKDCPFDGWGISDCGHNEDVGVWCTNTSAPTSQPPTTPAPTPSLPEVRLVGANRSDFGRLEVYHNGTWGTVCDDNWDNNDAIVVCRMVGYLYVKFTGPVGNNIPGSGSILMDEVKCNGSEKSLKDCPFDGWGISDCGHNEDVGVWCTNTTAPTSQPPTTAAPTPSLPEVRLVGANRSDFGRLEVYHNGSWGTVCDDNWDNNDAIVVCRMVGYLYVKFTGAVGNNIPGSGSILMDEVRCNGSEKSLKDCPFDGWGISDCGHNEDVGVWCTNTSAPTSQPPTTPASTPSLPEVRLVGANRSDFGRLEVYHNGSWGTVCDDNWDNNDAIVVCRMVGYLYVKFTGAVGNNIPGSGSILMDEVKCNGSEKSLKDCPFDGWGISDCGHNEDVGVWCTNTTAPTSQPPTTLAPTPPLPEVRLVGANRSDFGRLEVYHNGSWGTVCDDNWDNNDAVVVCRMLGYLYVVHSGAVGNNIPGSGTILMDEVKCNGSEKSLKDCPFDGWGISDCGHNEDVGVWCTNTTTAPSTTPRPTIPAFSIRLAGRTANFGRVEVLHNGTWGTICADLWDVNAGIVTCRMLGYPYVWFSGVIGATLPGSGQIWLDDVKCTGNESSLLNCSHNAWGVHNCKHSEDVGVWCGNTPTPPPPTTPKPTTPPPPKVPIRLVGGRTYTEGRVEIFHNEKWGTICDDNWDIQDAHVTCRMLGLPGATNAVVKAGFGPGTVKDIWLDEVACVGAESSLAKCQHSGWGVHDCSHTEDAGVVCQRAAVDNKVAGCNFDIDYCYWQHVVTDKFDWARKSGQTDSADTGPSGDHTSGKGHYVYIETSDCSTGDVAKLVGPLLGAEAKCLSFYYNMYGATIRSLRVKVGNQLLWELSGNQGQKWYKATVPLNFTDLFQVTFEGVCGADYRSDLAIDDIQVVNDTQCTKYAESAVPAKVTFISGSATVTNGTNASLSCSGSGFPTPNIMWFRNNKLVAGGYSSSNYTIKGITIDQGGEYTCLATNIHGTDRRTTRIFVLHKPMNTTTYFNASFDAAMPGDSVGIFCTTDANPKATCDIYHHGNKLASGSYVLRNFTSSDQGEYNCNCSNILGMDHGVKNLTVYEKPVINTLFPKTQNVSETGDFSIFCNATGNPRPNITWAKISSRDKVFPPGKTLSISSISVDADGIYTCIADNGRNKAKANSTVIVHLRIPRITGAPRNISVVEDVTRNISLHCNVTGIPQPNITWFKVGRASPVAYGEKLTVTARKEVMGTYECVAMNGIGKAARAKAYVRILYKPYSTTLTSDRANHVVLGNKPLNIKCSSIANPPADRYEYYLDGKHVFTSTNGYYRIARAKSSDQGTYTCYPANAIGFGNHNASIDVLVYGALSIDTAPLNTTVTEGDNVTLFCNASSKLQPVIKWRKSGDSSVTFPNGQFLRLKHVQKKEAGDYECVTENGIAAPDIARASVVVQYKPNIPSLVTSLGSTIIYPNESFSLTCTTTAIPPVTNYIFYHNGAQIGQSVNGVFNLTHVTSRSGNGTFSCAAENDIGRGPQRTITLKFLVCGRKILGSSIHSQIVGGTTAQHGAWPWQVQLGYEKGATVLRHICGGSILNRYWIVTAAHCVTESNALGFTAVQPQYLNVSLGEQFLYKADGTEQNIPAEQVIVHRNYYDLDYDIALIKLKRPITFNAYVFPICLPSFDFAVGTACYVSGWGRITRFSAVSDVLQEAAIPLMSRAKCKDHYSGIKAVTSRMRCAGTYGQAKGTCKGDSGGPLVCTKNGQWYLMGATSWSSGGCADSGYPGVYTDMLYFKSWIQNITSIIY